MNGPGTNPCVVVAACCRVDGVGDLTDALEAMDRLTGEGFRVDTLVIDPLEAGWDTPLAPDHFRCGCAPVEALHEAKRRLEAGETDAVVIAGDDPLRSLYAADPAKRRRRMAVFGEDHPLPDLYTRLAKVWLERWGLTADGFRELAERLFRNYVTTREEHGPYTPPSDRWFEPITDLFRGVDCANPSVDFEGRLVLTREETALESGLLGPAPVRVVGVGLGETTGDGPGHIDEIAAYAHLTRAYEAACTEAGVSFAERFRAGRARLEAYTCYPVVPLAFLVATGVVDEPAEIPRLLAARPITVTGGMNLGKAPWNNPALHALVTMVTRLETGGPPLGLVHGNGGLGYKQGVALLAV